MKVKIYSTLCRSGPTCASSSILNLHRTLLHMTSSVYKSTCHTHRCILLCIYRVGQNCTLFHCNNFVDSLSSCWQQVVVMEFGKRYDTTDTTTAYITAVTQRSFARANLLQTCYGETSVIDFGLNRPQLSRIVICCHSNIASRPWLGLRLAVRHLTINIIIVTYDSIKNIFNEILTKIDNYYCQSKRINFSKHI